MNGRFGSRTHPPLIFPRHAVLLVVTALFPLLSGCRESVDPPETIGFSIVSTFPHDDRAFTQGLLYHDGRLYESTGKRGRSTLRRVNPESGIPERTVSLSPEYFGEGLALLDEKLYQLTWESGTGFVYDLATLRRTGTFSYEGEGWGLTTDGTHLILSDGTDRIRFYDPAGFTLVRSIRVRDDRGSVDLLNELEWIDGALFANRWETDEVVRISPENGHVTGRLFLSSLLLPRPRDTEAVLNGIAHVPESGLVYVTGKYWPRMFLIRLEDP